MIVFLIILLLATVLGARLARKALQRDRARSRRRWQIFVPRAHVTRLERDLSGYSVEIHAIPYPSPNERQMLVIDTAKIPSFMPQPVVSVVYEDDGILNSTVVRGDGFDGTSLTALIKDPDERQAREALDTWEIFTKDRHMTVTIKDPDHEWFDTMLGHNWWYDSMLRINRPEFSLMITGVV